MKVDLERKDKNVVQLDVEIDSEEVAKEYHKSCKRISQRISIPGFRKGKAPRNVVETYVGIEKIKKDALDRLIPNIFAEIISEQQFDVVSEPIVESLNFELGKPLTMAAKLELRPDVKLPVYKGITVDVECYKTPDDYVIRELNALAERYANLKVVIDRPTKNTDLVNIDYTGTINGEPIRGGSAKNHLVDIAKSGLIPGFSEQLVDKRLGEEFTINVTFPEKYPDSTIAGKDALFDIKINEIKEKVIPALSDDFAKLVSKGQFEKLDALKEDILKHGEKSVEVENEIRIKKALVKKIIDDAEIDVHDSLINREAKILLEEVQSNLKSRGMTWEEMLDNKGHEAIWEDLRQEALSRIKSSLVLSEIAKNENIEITDQDYFDRIKEMATYYKTGEQEITKYLETRDGMISAVGKQILSHKVLNFLISVNEVNYLEKIESDNNNEESAENADESA